MNHKLILFFLLGIDVVILIFQTSELSISFHEISLLHGKPSLVQYIVNSSIGFFGQNDFALRAPMIILHTLSAILLYFISSQYVPSDKNRLWLVLIFLLLPGTLSSALLVNSAGVVIFSLFLFVYIFQRYHIKYSYLLLSLYSIADGDFLYLFMALVVYSLYNKEKYFLLFNSILLSISVYIYGLGIDGIPKGHFLDAIGLYSAIFTPIIFIYFVYVLYRRFLSKELDIVWFISTTILIFSLILSFRQRINIENFAPYLMLVLPLATQTFYRAYRVRLHMFRKNYKMIFTVSFIFLIVNFLTVFMNKELYRFIDNPKKHFAYDMHVAKELAFELHKQGIDCVTTDMRMSERIEFYGIKKCEEYRLTKVALDAQKKNNVTISYKNKIVYRANVTKINKQ